MILLHYIRYRYREWVYKNVFKHVDDPGKHITGPKRYFLLRLHWFLYWLMPRSEAEVRRFAVELERKTRRYQHWIEN